MNEVTRVICAIKEGDENAADQLLPLVYEELRRLARQRMAKEGPGQTLQPTALVHEAYVRLVGDEGKNWDSRGHFFGAAAEAMRRILIDRARRKRAIRHGGNLERVDIEHAEIILHESDDRLLEIDEALGRLETKDPTKAKLVKLHYFVGLTIKQAAEVMEISEPTAKRYLTFARAWIYREVGASGP